MFLRPALIALVVLGAAAMAAAEPANRSSTTVRAPATASGPLTPTPPRRPPIVVGPTIMEAQNSFKCSDNTIYTLSVEGGQCTPDVVTLPGGERVTRGMTCQNAGGSNATASCVSGCGQTTGSGSCTIR